MVAICPYCGNHSFVNSWGDSQVECAKCGRSLDYVWKVEKIPDNPTPEQEKQIIDAGVDFIMNGPGGD